MEESGVLDNTVVMVTSDHGEQFGEHGLMDHGNSLYVPLLEVPLVVHYPDEVPAGVRIETPVSLRDVAITLADLAGAEPAPFPGTSLASLWTDDPATPSPIYSEVREGIRPVPWLPLAKGPLSSVLHGDFHYIMNGDGTEEFYDLSRDPDELIDLSDSARAQIALKAARTTLSRLRADGARHAGR
jgi:arylsulfatase A-like enzyme